MRIGIDIDGCVRDIHSKLIQVYKREMGKDHWCDEQEKWKKYEISPHFSIGDGIYDFWFYTHAEEIYTKSLPFSDVSQISSLITFGHDIIILTDQPNPKTREYTLQWINEYLPYNEIHFTDKKHLISCDIYLDDSPYHLREFKNRMLDYVIMNRSWNQNIGGDRVKDLTEFKEMIVGARL
jgi:5'(3')-deoxyribonucleotidase